MNFLHVPLEANMHSPTWPHSEEHLTHWFWWSVSKASPCVKQQKISSDRYSSRCLFLPRKTSFHLQKHANIRAYVGVRLPLWSPRAQHSCGVKAPSTHAVFSLAVHSGKWGKLVLSWFMFAGDEMYIFQRRTCGEWSICTDKTMIYSGWSSRGRVLHTLTVMNYLLSL